MIEGSFLYKLAKSPPPTPSRSSLAEDGVVFWSAWLARLEAEIVHQKEPEGLGGCYFAQLRGDVSSTIWNNLSPISHLWSDQARKELSFRKKNVHFGENCPPLVKHASSKSEIMCLFQPKS